MSRYLWEMALVPTAARLDVMLSSKEDGRGAEGSSTLMAATHTCQQLQGRKRGEIEQKVALATSWLPNKEKQVSDLPRASNNNSVFFPKKRTWASVNKDETAWSYF